MVVSEGMLLDHDVDWQVKVMVSQPIVRSLLLFIVFSEPLPSNIDESVATDNQPRKWSSIFWPDKQIFVTSAVALMPSILAATSMPMRIGFTKYPPMRPG